MPAMHSKRADWRAITNKVFATVLFLAGVFILFVALNPTTNAGAVAQGMPVASSSPMMSQTPPAPSMMPSPTPTLTVKKPEEPAIPTKAVPLRLVVASAAIDTPISELPMTAEQVASRDFIPPQNPQGYSVNLFDMPGRDSTDLSLIVGHGCAGIPECAMQDWQFSRLSDPTLVHVGTAISVYTANGQVCSTVTRVVAYDYSDAAGQATIFGGQGDRKPGEIVLAACYTQDIHGKNIFVISSIHPCG